jgi:hypothetical protein
MYDDQRTLYNWKLKGIMNISQSIFGLITTLGLTVSMLIPTVTGAQALSLKKDEIRKEFSACEVKTTRPYNSTLLYKNKKFLEGNPRYTADIYKFKSTNKRYVGYQYNLKDKGRIVGNFQFNYIEVKVPTSTSTQIPIPGTINKGRKLWNTTFTGCGPRPKDQSYPVVSFLFYDTVIGYKLTGYRSPKQLGQVTNPNPFRLVNVINQLDGPDFGM